MRLTTPAIRCIFVTMGPFFWTERDLVCPLHSLWEGSDETRIVATVSGERQPD